MMLDPALERRLGWPFDVAVPPLEVNLGSGRSATAAIVVRRLSFREEGRTGGASNGSCFDLRSLSCIRSSFPVGSPIVDWRSCRARVASAFNSSWRQLNVWRSLGIINCESS